MDCCKSKWRKFFSNSKSSRSSFFVFISHYLLSLFIRTQCHIIYLVWTHKIKVQNRDIIPHILIYWLEIILMYIKTNRSRKPSAANDIHFFENSISQNNFTKLFGVKFSLSLSEVFHLSFENVSQQVICIVISQSLKVIYL